MNKLLAPALALLVFSCSFPLGPTASVPSQAPQASLAPGQTRLVLKTPAARALLSDAGFLTLSLRALPAGETRYATAAKAGDGSYSIMLEDLTAGDWQLSARLYPTSEDPTLLFSADQPHYLAPGTEVTVDLKMYEPGTIAGIVPEAAIVATTLQVRNFHTGALWMGDQNLSLGLPLRLSATVTDSETTPNLASDQRVEWTSSNPTVANISASGRVLPLKSGSTTLKATSVANRGVVASFLVSVQASAVGYWKAVDGTIAKIVPNLGAGPSLRLTIVQDGTPAYRTGPLTSTGADRYSLLLNKQLTPGEVAPLGGPQDYGSLEVHLDGSLSITGANFYGTKVFDRVTDPKPVTSLDIDVSNPSQLVASTVPADATIAPLFWASLDEAAATINPLTGVVTAVNGGPVAFVALSLEDPTVHRQIWYTGASAQMPHVIISGPVSVNDTNSLASFSVTTNVASISQVQWLIDGRVVDTRVTPSAPLVLNANGLGSGPHQVQVKVAAVTGSYTSQPWNFTVGQKAKIQVSSSGHTLLLKPDGSLWGWGPNPAGQLGLGAGTNHVHRPQFIDSNVAQVAAGGSHSLYLKNDGSLWFMGSSSAGASGDGTNNSSNTPYQVASGNIQAIAAGDLQSWILKNDGTLWSTGHNYQGALGTGDNSNRSTFTQVLTDVAAVYPSLNGTTFALTTAGALWSTGRNEYGELGDGFASARNSFFPTTLVGEPGLTGSILSVAAGYDYAVVVTSTGQVWTTGRDDFGQLGNGASSEDIHGFQLVTTIPGLVKVATSGLSAMLLKNDGTVYAAGRNEFGEYGDGTTNNRDTFSEVDVLRPAPVVDLFAAVVGFYYLLADGSFWGSGSPYTESGPTMGLGHDIDQRVPAPIPLDPVPPQIFTNGNRTFALYADGTLKATGNQNLGALGDGVVTNTNLDTWVTIPTFSASLTFVSVAPGTDHTLFLLSNGTVWAAGSNALGQLGDGTTTNRPTPADIVASKRAYQVTNYSSVFAAKAIAAGGSFSMILQTDGQVVAFGSNSGGQLGLPLGTSYSASPGVVSNISGAAVAIAAGSDFGLILKADGTVYGAGVDSGNSHGQAGFAAAQQTPYAQVPGLSTIFAIAAGPQFSFAIGLNHTLYAAGWNAAGQLGYNVDANFDTYFDDPEGFTQVWTRVKSVAAGNQHTLIQRTDGTLWGTGAALASGSATNTAVPQFLGEALSLGAGGNNSFVVRPDSTLWWFGSDELGNGITGTQSATATPQRVW